MPKASPERTAAIAAGERFYSTGKPCSRGHFSKRYVRDNRCARCASDDALRCAATADWHPARQAAKDAGLRHWTTGEPCQNGHDAMRYVSNGYCTVCDAGKNKRYHSKRPGLATKWTRDRRRRNPEKHRESVKRWKENNREKAKEMLDRWKAANPERVRAIGVAAMARRRSRKAANGGSFTVADIEALHERQHGRCAVCPSAENLEIDHVLPIVLGGSSDPINLQLLCLPCNRSKGGKHPDAWREELATKQQSPYSKVDQPLCREYRGNP